ncbi:MAG: amylo-alpha-1,6-glucosidase [Limisphaerales bacterium]
MEPLLMSPAPGERLLRFVGDTVRFTLETPAGVTPAAGWRARLRTTLGRGPLLLDDIIRAHYRRVPPFGACWHDVPMRYEDGRWTVEIPLVEPFYAAAKAYVMDADGHQHWPHGPDAGIAVHPDRHRTGNTVYCAFTRLYGETRTLARVHPDPDAAAIAKLRDGRGFAVLPRSGTLRDLTRELPHIVDRLGCRILHLLPVNPVPTTFGRFGPMGSPYAALDFTAIDPALVEFDRRTTGVEQFEELTRAAHARGAAVFLDMVINHTGWGSTLYERHPEWFKRDADGRFHSPGAWGVTWEDLVELEQQDVALWDHFAEAFLTWCRRGVDGFRCDAGYMVPVHVWQHIVARVKREFPNTVFLLEGLGGSWEATEQLLTHGGMQWAYSELFQNHSGEQVSGYLDYALRQSARVGLYMHYSETHDNDRLAARGRAWSLLRNRLCALTSVSGGWGFTGGVEWLAAEKIRVHERTGLNWDASENLVGELARLNRLLHEHPAFFDGAKLTRLSPPGHPLYALRRTSADGACTLLVLVNTDTESSQALCLAGEVLPRGFAPRYELADEGLPGFERLGHSVEFRCAPGAVHAVSDQPLPVAGFGDRYRERRAAAAWALECLARVRPPEQLGHFDFATLAQLVLRDPAGVLAAGWSLAGDDGVPAGGLVAALEAGRDADAYPRVVEWCRRDASRVLPLPPGHWLLVRDDATFRAQLAGPGLEPQHRQSIRTEAGHVAAFLPATPRESVDAVLFLDGVDGAAPRHRGTVRLLASAPGVRGAPGGDALLLLTNGRGGMARLRADFGTVASKYDCALAVNPHPRVPVDRHVLAKRVRLWLNADGFISALDGKNLTLVEPGPPARWQFVANAGDGRTVTVEVLADMPDGRNATVLQLARPAGDGLHDARVIARVDVEDRGFHAETQRNSGADAHFQTHCEPLAEGVGFRFAPAPDRRFTARASVGKYHHEAEWSTGLPHPVEAGRGQTAAGDAYSPGWFLLPLPPGGEATLVLSTDEPGPEPGEVAGLQLARRRASEAAAARAGFAPADALGRQLAVATQAFVVRRDDGWTVIAGYPWFLDWGRDTLIAARGLLAAGLAAEVRHIVQVYGRFADRGTLPNAIHGENTGNRDTSDAPLWYGVVVEELAAAAGAEVYAGRVRDGGPTVLEVLCGLAEGLIAGAPNGVRRDPASGLLWSPAHFTWMDTNHPAASPREGYPVEIQALWIRLLRQLARVDAPGRRARWEVLAREAGASFEKYFWRESEGWLSDTLHAPAGIPAADATPDDALRPNMLLAVSLGLITGRRARRIVTAARDWLLVPGALRSLAPRPVSPPLPVQAADGRLLNDPAHPYWPRYEGDEDTRRKPAYHNGTAWGWMLGPFCEALARAWDFQPEAVAAARAYAGSVERLLGEGCLGQLPEILDGDAPHAQRGCDAQAWSVTEALRVWRLLAEQEPWAWRLRCCAGPPSAGSPAALARERGVGRRHACLGLSFAGDFTSPRLAPGIGGAPLFGAGGPPVTCCQPWFH